MWWGHLEAGAEQEALITVCLWSTYCVRKGLQSVEAWVCFPGMYSI